MPASVLRHADYMDAVAYADHWMTPVTASFLDRDERRKWFQVWTQMRFAATQNDIRTIRGLTDTALVRAAKHYSNGASMDSVGFFQMYEMQILASMTKTELHEFNIHLRYGQTDAAYDIYARASMRLSTAEHKSGRTV